MDKKEKKFDEQDHPLKNTDNAFVKVGKDGEPVFPVKQEKEDQKVQENDSSNDHR